MTRTPFSFQKPCILSSYVRFVTPAAWSTIARSFGITGVFFFDTFFEKEGPTQKYGSL